MKNYEYVIVGAGISGCSVAYELSKYTSNILLIDASSQVASGASGAAGAFLSPLLGKPNEFKDLVTRALKYSTKLYKEKFPNVIDNCGTTRIPKNKADAQKFESYKPYMDFPYSNDALGYHFKVGSVVNSYGICKMMTGAIDKLFDYEVTNIIFENGKWNINNEILCDGLILATGSIIKPLDEEYIQIRPVWGYRIDVQTSTKLSFNYHKECSVSKSFFIENNKYKVSIGATHHRDYKDVLDDEKNIQELLKKAKDIIELENVEVVKSYVGARASSFDYFPVVGKIIDSKTTLKEFPYLVNGTHVNDERFTRYENLYILNGVGGRGFVLAPYLAKILAENIINKKAIEQNITVERLFKRYVKKGNKIG